jgi:hypothetical protein
VGWNLEIKAAIKKPLNVESPVPGSVSAELLKISGEKAAKSIVKLFNKAAQAREMHTNGL